VFSEEGAYPHITLLMGEVSDNHRAELTQRILVLARSIPSVPLHFTPPRRPAPDSAYVFLGIEPKEPLRQIKAQIAERVQNIFALGEYGNVDTVPHVTVAYFVRPEEYCVYPQTAFKEVAWQAPRIAISETGPYGTCVNRLEIINIRQANKGHSPREPRQEDGTIDLSGPSTINHEEFT